MKKLSDNAKVNIQAGLYTLAFFAIVVGSIAAVHHAVNPGGIKNVGEYCTPHRTNCEYRNTWSEKPNSCDYFKEIAGGGFNTLTAKLEPGTCTVSKGGYE